MQEDYKTGTEEENLSHHCVQDGQKDKSTKSETFQESLVKCCSDSEGSREEHPFFEWPEDSIFFFDSKNFTVSSVVNKRNDRVVAFGNDVSEHRGISTATYPPSILMLGVVASNGEKMPRVWFKRSYRITSAVFKEVLHESSFVSQEDH